MSSHSQDSWAIDHPEVVAIALDVTLNPSRRRHYSALVLMLADAAAEKIRQKIQGIPEVKPSELPESG